MKNLFEETTVQQINDRIASLRPDSQRVWGKMDPAQMLAHCCASMEDAVGKRFPPRRLLGRLFGRFAKEAMLVKGEPIRPNSPTEKSLVIEDSRNFEVERERLLGLIDSFAAGGPAACTKHPQSFFGPLTPREWAILMYQHLDHHLRQFGV
jgi:Protein of unknown function (DUF1569)